MQKWEQRWPTPMLWLCLYKIYMFRQKQISAIILAGGKSSRMMRDKGLITLHNKPLIKHVIETVKRITENIIIISANPTYKQFGYPCFEDSIKDKGPLSGILTGLINSTTQKNFVIGCDMPFLSTHILRKLINNCKDFDVILAEHNSLAEPLCGIYDKSCIPHFKLLLDQNQLKIMVALEGLKTRVISFDKEDWFVGNEFANINTIEELKKFDQ